MKPNQKYLAAALKGVESESIRKWATSDHNKPIFEKLAQNFLDHNKDVQLFTIFIVSNAMGL